MRAPYGWPGCPLKEPVALLSSGRYVAFQMAEIAVSRQMFDDILALIAGLRTPPRRYDKRWGQVWQAMRGKVCLGAERRF